MKSKNELSEIIWDPLKIIKCTKEYKFAIVILNQPILLHHDYMLALWEKAQVTVTVDGGTNHWINYLGDQANDILTRQCKKYLPMLVTGDMDSILPDLLNKLKNTEAKIIYTPDTKETDFTKAIIELREYVVKNNITIHGILVFSETAGRLDHIISNINTLYKCDKLLDDIPVIQINGQSLTWLLKPGLHKIIIPNDILKSKSWCALIPFGHPNNCVTTTGLRWNLDKTCMKFGELLSTSNTYDNQPEVTINTNVPLIWTMGIESLMNTNKP